ncbi:MAG TPA: hypothetical protein VFC96_05075 [Anaerovoracaceae bacterium]|nr:hypothetical protein [Anaerovoracaceae bacterium]
MNMKAKAIVLILFMSLLLGSCGGVSEEPSDGSGYFSDFLDAIDIELAKTVIKNVSNFGDDPVMGMRSAGSPAETDTANYLEDVMKDIGLENVTLEEITVDGWTFEGANLTFTNTLGETQKIDLAGYQTTIQSDNEECELVYINRAQKKITKELT